MLGERRSAILGLIIEEYIRSGEPIGSKTICRLLPYSVSSATVRNEMAYLSQLGLLEQRHTSGGRVPSKDAYRFYIDNLMNIIPLQPYETQKIDAALTINAGDHDRLLADSSKQLADLTHCMSFYCILEDEYDCIQGVELIPAGDGRVMLILLTVSGRIESSICKLSCAADEEFRSAFYKLAASRFIGTQLSDITLAAIQNSAGSLGDRVFDMLPVLISLCSMCEAASKSKLVIDGEINLLSHDELGNGVYNLLSFLTRRDKIISILTDYAKYNKNDIALFIGDENPCYDLKNTSTIISQLNYSGGQKALLGIVGSMRLDYRTILPRAEYIMKETSVLLREGGLNNG